MIRKISTIGSTEPAEHGTSQDACSGNKEPIRGFPSSFHLDPFLSPV